MASILFANSEGMFWRYKRCAHDIEVEIIQHVFVLTHS